MVRRDPYRADLVEALSVFQLSNATVVAAGTGVAPEALMTVPRCGVMFKPSFGFARRLDAPVGFKRSMLTWSADAHLLAVTF